jgi:hypothetical protein
LDSEIQVGSSVRPRVQVQFQDLHCYRFLIKEKRTDMDADKQYTSHSTQQSKIEAAEMTDLLQLKKINYSNLQ